MKRNFQEKSDANHFERALGTFPLNDRIIEVVVTRHADYRVLEQKNIKLQQLVNLIASIGQQDLEQHFIAATAKINSDEKDWRIKVKYEIAVYNVINKIVLMLGIHPHLHRITILTIISRIRNVEVHNVYGVYRIDNAKTQNERIDEIITQPQLPQPRLKLKRIVLPQF